MSSEDLWVSAVQRKGAFKLSFSAMTFPHQLMRLILLEQLVYAAGRKEE